MGKVYICSEETSVCPVCSNPELKAIGSRKRKVIETDGAVKTLIIRRLRCVECEKIHHELPDIIIPYKRHCAETVEGIINNETREVYCEESTVRKIKQWWRTMYLYFQSVIESLSAKYSLPFSESIKPCEIVRAVANAHLWVHTRTAFMSG